MWCRTQRVRHTKSIRQLVVAQIVLSEVAFLFSSSRQSAAEFVLCALLYLSGAGLCFVVRHPTRWPWLWERFLSRHVASPLLTTFRYSINSYDFKERWILRFSSRARML